MQTIPTTLPLTIDTARLKDLWLPEYRNEADSLEYMNRACLRAVGKKNFNALNTARCALAINLSETCAEIRDRGGLLLIGGAA